MDKKQASNIAHITTRDLIILVFVFVLILPTLGFKAAEWYYVNRDDSYVSQVTQEASAVINAAKQAEKSYKQEKDDLINQPALCTPKSMDTLLKEHLFPLKQDQ